MSTSGTEQQAPVEAVLERLNDPGVAASLVTLLDNAEFLSTMVLAFGGFVARGEVMMDAVADGVQELKETAVGSGRGLPSVSDVSTLVNGITSATPAITRMLASPMFEQETIDLLVTMAGAATEGMTAAGANGTSVTGLRGALKALKDPEVQKGLGVVIEISRALGRAV